MCVYLKKVQYMWEKSTQSAQGGAAIAKHSLWQNTTVLPWNPM